MKYRTIILGIFAIIFAASITSKGTAQSGQDAMTVNIGAIMRAKDGKSDELRKALHSLVNPTRAESGCIAYNLYKLKKVHSFV